MHRSILPRLVMAAAALVLVIGGARPAFSQDEKTPLFAQVLPKDGQVLVTWGAVVDATGYTVSRRAVADAADKNVIVNASPIKETSLVDSNLTNGTALIYSVQAIFADGTKGDPKEAVGTPHAAILGRFQSYDIETVNPGGVKIDGNVMTIRGSGADLWDAEDGHTFLATPVTGDFTISMKVLENPTIENGETSNAGKVGLEAKAGMIPKSPYAYVFTSVERTPKYMSEGRFEQGGGANWSGGIGEDDTKIFPAVLRLSRRGNVFIHEVSLDDGKTFEKVFDDQTMENAPAEMYVGIGATSHTDGLYINGKIDVPSIVLTTP